MPLNSDCDSVDSCSPPFLQRAPSGVRLIAVYESIGAVSRHCSNFLSGSLSPPGTLSQKNVAASHVMARNGSLQPVVRYARSTLPAELPYLSIGPLRAEP